MGKSTAVAREGGRRLSDTAQDESQERANLTEVMDRLLLRYGRSGSGRASALRLIGAYMIFQTEGGAGFRRRGYSRDSIQLYRDKLHEAGVPVR